MALITVSDITTYMDITFTNVQEDAAEIVIEGLQSELEAYLRRPIEQQEFTETYRVPDVGRGVVNQQYYYNYTTDPATTLTSPGIIYTPMYTLYLENSPVISVSSVSITAASAGATPIAQVAERDYITRDFGIELFNAFANDVINVTYTAGLDGANIKVFKLLMLRAAAREMQNMHDDVVGLKDLTTRNVAPLETGFSERELLSIKKYRRVRVS
jgi:hypothetical protein